MPNSPLEKPLGAVASSSGSPPMDLSSQMLHEPFQGTQLLCPPDHSAPSQTQRRRHRNQAWQNPEQPELIPGMTTVDVWTPVRVSGCWVKATASTSRSQCTPVHSTLRMRTVVLKLWALGCWFSYIHFYWGVAFTNWYIIFPQDSVGCFYWSLSCILAFYINIICHNILCLSRFLSDYEWRQCFEHIVIYSSYIWVCH